MCKLFKKINKKHIEDWDLNQDFMILARVASADAFLVIKSEKDRKGPK